jgi:hypothetical protein
MRASAKNRLQIEPNQSTRNLPEAQEKATNFHFTREVFVKAEATISQRFMPLNERLNGKLPFLSDSI